MTQVIAIDARLVGYAAGIAQYVRLLSDALSRLPGPERYMVLRSRRGRHERLGTRDLVQRWAITPPHNRFERWSLPLELLGRPPRPALLHSVDHVAPAWRNWRSVVTLHDLAFLLYPTTHTAESRAYYAASGESVRQAERVIAVSQRTASDAVRLFGVDPARIRVVPEAASPSFSPRGDGAFQSAARRLGLGERPFALFVGTLEPRKNVPLLFEAFVEVRRTLDAQLLLVGGRGWLDEPIFAAHARSGLGDAVRFLGNQVDQEDLAALYSRAGVFVLPSLYEGFGLPVLEAMACGAPVICSNAGPLPDVAGEAAILLPPDDSNAWAQAILALLSDGRLADAWRQKGFARAATFSWERAALATREVYREALLA